MKKEQGSERARAKDGQKQEVREEPSEEPPGHPEAAQQDHGAKE